MQQKNLLVVMLCMMIISSYAQETETTKVYEIRNSIAVYPCDITGERLYTDGRFSTPPLHAKFMLVKPLHQNRDTLMIRYLVWNKIKDSALRKYYNDPLIRSGWTTEKTDSVKSSPVTTRWSRTVDTAGTGSIDTTKSSYDIDYENKIDRFFLIAQYDLDSNCTKVYNRGVRSMAFTVGLVTMPLKLRLGSSFDFQGNLSLGSTAGVKMRLSKFNSNYLNLLIGTSISTITLDSFSTKGKLTGQPLNNIAVFSPSVGAVFEFGKAQAGIFLGWDILNKSTQSQYEWIHNKKPWLSIGFGFSIFNVDSKSNGAQPDTQ